MIVTVTLNTAIDRILSVGELRLGKVVRGTLIASVPAGKGVNVSRCLAALGVPSIVTGFVGRREAALYDESFRETPVTSMLIELTAPTRVSTTLLSDGKGGETHIREEGFPVPAQEKLQLRDLLFELSSAHGPFILAGSLPPDFSPAEFTGIIAGLKSRGARVTVDTSGTALQSSLAANVDLIAPNEDELAELAGKPLGAASGVVEAARSLLDSVPEIAVKRGRKGGMLVRKDVVLTGSIDLEDLKPESTVGAGDAFLAGLLAARAQEKSDEETLASAVAAGCASVLTRTSGTLDLAAYDSFLSRVEVRKL
jgi:1-phosphofructokinase